MPDGVPSARLYRDLLHLPLEGPDGYLATDSVDGAKHFALWPLSQAASSCFGSERWPSDLPTPSAWIEFDVDDVAAATDELAAAGYRILVASRTEPWGQTVSRLLSPEGLLVGVTFTPWMRPNLA